MAGITHNFSIEDLEPTDNYADLCAQLSRINAKAAQEKYIFDPSKSEIVRYKELFREKLQKQGNKKQFYGIVLDIQPTRGILDNFYKVYVDVPGFNHKKIDHPDLFSAINLDLEYFEDLVFYPTDFISAQENVPLLGGIAIVEISPFYPFHTDVDKFSNKFIKMINFSPFITVSQENRKLTFAGPLFSRYGGSYGYGTSGGIAGATGPVTGPIDQMMVDASALPFNKRLQSISSKFVGKPYKLGPLGEGEGKDPDPRLNYDAFDCLTFVETMMTLSTAGRESRALGLMDQVRYAGGKVGFSTRNHIMESQWIPENLRRGAIREVGSSLAGANPKTMTKTFTEQTIKDIPPLEVPGGDTSIIPRGTYGIPVIPTDSLLGVGDKIPDGSLITVVREQGDEHVSIVTHTAIFFRDESGKAFVRHAASGADNRVVDEPYDKFIARMKRGSRKLAGFGIYEILPAGGT